MAISPTRIALSRPYIITISPTISCFPATNTGLGLLTSLSLITINMIWLLEMVQLVSSSAAALLAAVQLAKTPKLLRPTSMAYGLRNTTLNVVKQLVLQLLCSESKILVSPGR